MTIKNDEEILKCSKLVIKHLRSRERELEDSRNESSIDTFFSSLSQEEKIDTFRGTIDLICKSGDGATFCKAFDKYQEEVKMLGRELAFEEFKKIVEDIRKENIEKIEEK